MLTKEYILNCLDKYCTLENILHCQNFEDCIVNPLKRACCFENWTWESGATKGVLIFSGLNFVIKIPFTGEAEWEESHYEDKNGSYRYRYSSIFTDNDTLKSEIIHCEGQENYWDFCGADNENGWDYCEVEVSRYEKAIKVGLEILFAKTELLGYIKDSYPIYIQERCNMFNDVYSSSNSEKYKKRTKKDYEKVQTLRQKYDFYDIDDDWMLDFIIFYGEETMKQFAEFCWQTNIEDLHNGNIGYHNGIPCLVDYSSYNN